MARTFTTEHRTLEYRLRRSAARQGMKVVKPRRYDPLALDYDQYLIFDFTGSRVVSPVLSGLDELERWVLHPETRTAADPVPAQ